MVHQAIIAELTVKFKRVFAIEEGILFAGISIRKEVSYYNYYRIGRDDDTFMGDTEETVRAIKESLM